jgi:hypothetical protein
MMNKKYIHRRMAGVSFSLTFIGKDEVSWYDTLA